MPANPEAIAWYLKRSEDLLDDHRERVESLRRRAGQLAGFSGAVLALVGANIVSIFGALHGAPRIGAALALSIGAVSLILAVTAAMRGSWVPELVSDIALREVENYASARFTAESDLWRIHVRAIRGLRGSVESLASEGEEAAEAVRRAEFSFLVGLLLVFLAFAIVIAEVTF